MKNLTRLFLFLFFLVLISCKTEPKKVVEEFPLEDKYSVTIRLRAEPDRLNPMLTGRAWSRQVFQHIFPPVQNHDPESLELIPNLCKTRPKSEIISEGPYKGGTAYTFELLDEAVWDNGTPITGHDYVFTLKALFNPKVADPGYRSYLNMVKNVEVDKENPKKYTVFTDKPYMRAEYSSSFYIYPEYNYDPKGLMKSIDLKDLLDPKKASKLAESNPNITAFAEEFNSPKYSNDPKFITGPGAYKLVEWIPNQKIVLQKKENWWGDKLASKYPCLTAKPDKLIYNTNPDDAMAASLLKNESVDVLNTIPYDAFVNMKEDDLVNSKYNLYTPPGLSMNYLALNSRNPKLQDKRVRQAIRYLVDVDELIKTVSQGYGKRLNNPFPASYDYYNKETPATKLDVNKAKELLAAAGWKDSNGDGVVDQEINGERVEMNLKYNMTPTNTVSKNIFLIIQNNAKKAGINLESNVLEANLYIAAVKKREYEIFSGGLTLDASLYDPYQFWHTSSDTPNGFNRTGFGNAETDALIEKLRSTIDKTERNKYYNEFQEIIYEEAPMIFLFSQTERIAIHKKFKNVTLSVMSPGFFENYFH